MIKVIVTTTINPPTEAIYKFIEIAGRDGWLLCIIGDLRTPHSNYKDLSASHDNVFYLTPEAQDAHCPTLSDLIGWNCIQRRNMGFIWAKERGADIIATVDDDNIPDDTWGQDLLVGGTHKLQGWENNDNAVFDPLSVFDKLYWHRGYPPQLVPFKNNSVPDAVPREIKVLVEAQLWNGNPDIDAISRIALNPRLEDFGTFKPFCSAQIAPFNSQNTFLAKEVFPTYFLFPHIGRMDDIWAAYVLQHAFPGSVAFSRASVYQERNPHDLVKDLEAELLGYKHSLEVATDPEAYRKFVPERALAAYDEYKRYFAA